MNTRVSIVALVTVAMWLGAHRAADAATYYVSRSGNDGYSCGQAQSMSTPKGSLNNAVRCLVPGDTLLVRGGTYAEGLALGVVPAGAHWSAKVRIAAYPGEVVWMRPAAGEYRVLEFGHTQQYIEFDSINLDGSSVGHDAVKINAGITGHNAHHIRIMNAEVIGPSHSGSGSPTGQTFLATAGDGSAIGGNEFIRLRVHGGMGNDFDHSFYIQSSGNLIEYCEIWDFPGGAVQLYNANGVSPNNNIVRNNVIRDARFTWSGQRHVGIVTTGIGNQVYNNIIYNIPSNGSAAVGISVYEGSLNTGIYNNTVYNAPVGIVVDSGASGTVLRNNISYRNSGGSFVNGGAGTSESNNLFGIDPKFVNASNGDFRVQDGSPATDRGAIVSIVATDIVGTPRPQELGPDIGAYERVGSMPVTAPAPPVNVRIVSN